MNIQQYIVTIMTLVGLNQAVLGDYPAPLMPKSVSDSIKASVAMTDISGTVSELNLSNLDIYTNLRLIMRYEQSNISSDLFGGYCHLYSKNSGQLLASAPNMKVFCYKTHLIIFLANQDGVVEQVKVIRDFVILTRKNVSPIQIHVYKASAKKLLIDIDRAKLNSRFEPVAVLPDHVKDLVCVTTYSDLRYTESI